MAQLKSRLTLTFNLYETTNQNRLKTGGALSAYVYPAGVQIEASATIANGDSAAVTCSGRGALAVGSAVYVLRSADAGVNWTEQYVTGLSVTAIEEQAANEGRFSFTVQNSSGASITLNIGDRIVAARTVGNLVTLYEDESDPSDTITGNPIDVPTSGVFVCYVGVRGVDVYITGDTITNGWYSFNVPAYSGEIGPLRLRGETLAADTTVNVDADTAVVYLDTDTAAIVLIEHCAPGRSLELVPLVTGLQVITLGTATDNAIREASGRVIDLVQYESIKLMGVAASANTAYWVIQSKLAGVGLDDLADVTVGTPANPSILVSTGGDWGDAQALGTASDPFPSMVVASSGLEIADGDGDTSSLAFNGTADRTHTLPDVSGNVLVDTGTHVVTGLLTVDDDALVLRDPSATTKMARLDCAAITAGNTRVLTVQDKNYTLADDADVPDELNDLSDFTDVGAGASADGWPVVYSHTNTDHRVKDTVASFDAPLAALYSQGVSLVKPGVGAFQVDLVAPLSASGSLAFRLPGNGTGGSLLATTPSGQVVTGDIAFDDDGLLLQDPVTTGKRARFDVGAVTNGQTRVVSIPDRDLDLGKVKAYRTASLELVNDSAYDALLTQANALPLFFTGSAATITRATMVFSVPATLGAADVTLQLYYGAGLPTAATVPPASSTAVLNAVVNTAGLSSASYNQIALNVTAFANAAVPANNWCYLSVASGSNFGNLGAGGILRVIVEYEVN